jgi:Uma2 family endonuclease
MSVVTYPQAEQQFTWYQLSWDQYESLLRTFGDRRLRHTYVEGALEIVSPSMDHESSKSILADFVVTLCRLLKRPRKSIGSTTMKKRAWRRGLEPDEGFYIGETSVRRVGSRRDFDPDRDPPPDLIIEVDITSSSEDRIEFYRRLRVHEVWRYANESISLYGLMQNNRYRRLKRSRLFSLITSEDLTRFLAMRDIVDDTELDLRFERWVKSQPEGTKGSDD